MLGQTGCKKQFMSPMEKKSLTEENIFTDIIAFCPARTCYIPKEEENGDRHQIVQSTRGFVVASTRL